LRVSRQQETVGQYVDDASITTHVKAKFADDSTVAATSIRVETLKGQCCFRGSRNRRRKVARGDPRALRERCFQQRAQRHVVRTPS